MKQVLIISTSKRYDPSRQPLEDLAEFSHAALDKSGVEAELSTVFLDDLVHTLDGAKTTIAVASTGKDIASFDFVWLRGRFVPTMNEISVVAEYLQRKGANFANHSYAHRSAYGKVAQMHLLAELGLPYPKTLFATGDLAFEHFKSGLAFPMVVKNNQGSHGNKNFLVHDEKQLANILADNGDTDFVAQEFLENDSDYRLLIVGERSIIIRRTGAEGSHLNNTSQGGNADLVDASEFPEAVVAEARTFMEALHYDISGVDVLFEKHTGKHYFLEANSQPQIINGAFVEQKGTLLSDFFRSKLS